jgi:CRISPR-associated endonuclease/helicase Cas3
VRSQKRASDAFTHEDDSSLSTKRVTLKDHLQGVAQFAKHYAAGCVLPAEFQDLMERVGHLHDLGKLDERFQTWLYGGDRTAAFAAAEPLAKSDGLEDYRARDAARRKSKYPRGGRHELLSVQMAAAAEREVLDDSRDPELALHLIASHHGHCRPFAPYVRDDDPPAVRWEYAGVSRSMSEAQRRNCAAHSLDSGIADRFWRLVRRYGWWGLAWLEAIFVLADRGRSSYEENV